MAYSRTPAKFGEAEFGYSRLGVMTNKWERQLSPYFRTLYRGVACWFVARDGVTGWREPTFDYDNPITGLLSLRSAPSAYLPAGVFARLDGVVVTLDGFEVADRLYDPVDEKVYSVVDEPVPHREIVGRDASGNDIVSFCFRELQLKWLPTVPIPEI